MQEGSIRQDVETWLRYITSKFSKPLLDISATQRLISITMNNPEYKELIASLLIKNLETELELPSIMMLHLINTIIYNLRLTCRDNSDADFLGKLLDLGVDTFEKNLKRPWKDWPGQLGCVLMEWKQNYKIENRLTKDMLKLLEIKEKENLMLRDIHYTCVECVEDLAHYLRDHNTEQISIHLVRIWESSFYMSEPLLEPYNKILYSDASNEGWNDFIKITDKYLSFMLASVNTSNLIFRNSTTDKLGIIPMVFVAMHAATFIESCVGASVRALISLLKTMDTTVALNSQAFQRCMKEIISFFQYTVENMHSLSPFLCKYLCETCQLITKIKAQEDFWNEINGLLVLRLLAPAVSNPVLAGIVESADMNAVQLLTYTAKIIQHAWVGKVIEHGDLSTHVWLNDLISKWRNELQHSFYTMLNSRKVEPKSIALPRSLLIFDLMALESKMKGFSWNKCPGVASLGVVRPEISKKKEEDEIEEDIQIEEEPVVQVAKKVKVEEIEDSTPSMQSLPPVHEFFVAGKDQTAKKAPPDAFKSLDIEVIHEEPIENPFKRRPSVDQPVNEKPKLDMKDFSQRSKGVQSIVLYTASQYVQTEALQNNSKLVQTDSGNFSSKALQTEPEKQRVKVRSRIESTIQIMDQETITDLDLDEIYNGYISLKTQCEKLIEYKDNETIRIRRVNESWANQFREVKEENAMLKERISIVEAELEKVNRKEVEIFMASGLTKTYSHSKLRDDLASRYFIQDENILQKCDPNYYFGIEPGLSTVKSQKDFEQKEEWRSKFADMLKTFEDFK